MFSTLNKRAVGFYAAAGDSVFFVNLKYYQNLFSYSHYARTLPDKKRIKDLAQKISDEKWCWSEDGKRITLCSENSKTGGPVENFKLEKLLVYKADYNISGKELKLVPIKEYKPE